MGCCRGVKWDLFTGLSHVSDDLRSSLRKWGFAMYWMLSGNGIMMTGYLSKSYLIRTAKCIKAKAVIANKTAVIHVTENRRMFVHFCGLAMFVFLSVFRHDYGVVLFVLIHHSHRVVLSDGDML